MRKRFVCPCALTPLPLLVTASRGDVGRRGGSRGTPKLQAPSNRTAGGLSTALKPFKSTCCWYQNPVFFGHQEPYFGRFVGYQTSFFGDEQWWKTHLCCIFLVPARILRDGPHEGPQTPMCYIVFGAADTLQGVHDSRLSRVLVQILD